MKDPNEGLTPEGFIKTGVQRDRVAPLFEQVIEAALREVKEIEGDLQLDAVSAFLYGSVSTGTAVPPISDLDLLTVGIPLDAAERAAHALSIRFRDLCRGVEIAAARKEDFLGEADEAYGGRVFLRHYCLHLYGSKVVNFGDSFPGDVRAARGFNGDIETHYKRWGNQIVEMDPEQLGYRIARKSLLAVAGLVSIHDHIWTTDRKSSALRWVHLNPQWHPMMDKLIAWSEGTERPSLQEVTDVLSPDGIVSAIVDDFRKNIGFWNQA